MLEPLKKDRVGASKTKTYEGNLKMGWIIGIIIVIASLYFFFKFPKQMFVLLGIVVFGIFCIWYFAEEIPKQNRIQLQNSVTISISYDTTSCGSKYPLFVKIANNSQKSVKKISWDLNVFNPGYSTDLSGYNDRYSCDKILAPGQQWTSCYTLPSTIEKNGHNLSSLKYEVGYKSIDTED